MMMMELKILQNGNERVKVCFDTGNIKKSPKPPEFIIWYHNDNMMNYGSSWEFSVRTEPGARTHSWLTIRDARIADSGNYTCKTAHADASIFVYVSEASGLFSGARKALDGHEQFGGNSFRSNFNRRDHNSNIPYPSSSLWPWP